MKRALVTVALGVLLAGCSGGGESDGGSQATPAPTAASPADPTPSSSASDATPGPSSTDVPMVPISRDIDLARPRVWGIPADLGWELTVRDQNGENRLTGPDGCTLVTLQRAGTIAPIPGAVPGIDDQQPTDALATKHHLSLVVADAQPNARDFAVSGPAQSLPIAFGTERKQRVELAAVDFTYADAYTGERRHDLVAARLMPRPAAQLSVRLSCPEAAYAAARPVLDALLVLPG